MDTKAILIWLADHPMLIYTLGLIIILVILSYPFIIKIRTFYVSNSKLIKQNQEQEMLIEKIVRDNEILFERNEQLTAQYTILEENAKDKISILEKRIKTYRGNY